MKSKLVVAEKPAAARAIAEVLGARTHKDGSFEGNGYIVSWCIGHLLGLAEPQVYDAKYAKWRYGDLPIVPGTWQYTANEKTRKQLKILTNLMKRSDVEGIINACDAGREGELIFRLVYEHAATNKSIQRLWISSMEESAIADGFQNLRPGADYERLYQSALCRSKADWLVGMNYSRLFSVLYHANLRVGRVQTPTLSMIVERDEKIRVFVKEPFYKVELSSEGFLVEREKLGDKAAAERIRAACDGKAALIQSVERQEKSTSAPKLYDLTTLQREANRLFGYTAAQTLSCVQNLYERKIATYPRTDSRYITEDMAAGIPALIDGVTTVLPFLGYAGSVNVAQVVNNAKVTDHHAIIPTPTMPKADISALPTADRNILTMICMRLVSAVSEKHLCAETVVTAECEGETFTAKGKTVIQNGWKEVEEAFAAHLGKQKKDAEPSLPQLSEGQAFTAKATVREGFTQPPKQFTEDSLLSAMESAGAEDMPEDAERKGLGTPATRAAIIENLVKSGLLERKGKLLLPTDKGVNLIKVLPESVRSPLLTAEWESQLKQIEQGDMSPDAFLTAINEFVGDTVKAHNTVPDEHKALFPSNRQAGEVVGICPRCGTNVTEAAKGFFCESRNCKFALWKDSKFFTAKNKTLTKDIAKTLLTEGRIFMSGLISQKTGKPYNATIILEASGEDYPNFKMEFNKKQGGIA